MLVKYMYMSTGKIEICSSGIKAVPTLQKILK